MPSFPGEDELPAGSGTRGGMPCSGLFHGENFEETVRRARPVPKTLLILFASAFWPGFLSTPPSRILILECGTLLPREYTPL